MPPAKSLARLERHIQVLRHADQQQIGTHGIAQGMCLGFIAGGFDVVSVRVQHQGVHAAHAPVGIKEQDAITGWLVATIHEAASWSNSACRMASPKLTEEASSTFIIRGSGSTTCEER